MLATANNWKPTLAKIVKRYNLPFAVLVTRTSEVNDLPNGFIRMRLMTCSVNPDPVMLGDRMMGAVIPELIANNAVAIMYRNNELCRQWQEETGHEGD